MNISTNTRNELVIQATQIGVWDWYVQTGDFHINDIWAEMLGYKKEEFFPYNVNICFDNCHPDDLIKSKKLIEKHFRGETEYYECHIRVKHKDGHWVWIHDKGKVFEWDKEGKPIRMFGSHMNISKEKELELNLKQAVNERDILLKEVHHRVKNNLQLLLSLIKIKDKNDKISTKEMENSILSIAKAYEAIYQSDQIDEISIDNYFNQVITPIISRKNIDFKINSIDFKSNIDFLVPIGLIITELITNSIKHAFFDKSTSKKIEIINKVENNQLIIHYRDNGTGYGEEIIQNKESLNSIGIVIIQSLVQQLKGTLELSDKNGANTTIITPIIQ